MRSALIHKHEACLSKQTHSGSAKTHLQRLAGVGSAMATYMNGELADKSSWITHSLPQTAAECSGVRQQVRGPLAQIRLQITSERVHEWTTYDPYSRDAPGGSEARACALVVCACVSATATAAAGPLDLYECKRRTV